MKKYYCDICGVSFDEKATGCSTANRPMPVPGTWGVAASGLDICPRCMGIGKGIDFKAAMRGAWIQAVKASEEE